jgi:glycosyltransferase involved in cell wall biosynthesis
MVRVALVHDWLTGVRGGERCLEALLPLFPDAPIFTLIHHKGSVGPEIGSRRIHTSPLQRWPVPSHRYRWMLPAFPWAVSRLDLGDFDMVISVSHCAAKGALAAPGARHISYCLTPMRYAWDMGGVYWEGSPIPWPAAPVGALLRAYLRAWDSASSRRVRRFATVSRFVARRIRRYYGREAEVIPPPVDCGKFRPGGRVEDRFLVVSALTPYKRVGDAVSAFRKIGLPLIVVGDGPDRRRLEATAGPATEFLGRVDEETLRELYATSRALIFPGEEDFGLAPVEAMASGRPVVALGRGGVLDSVVPLEDGRARPPTGILYRRAGPRALEEAVRVFIEKEDRFDPSVARERALTFDLPRFQEKMEAFVAC